MRDDEPKDPTADFSAKIKRTLIELHGYAYFHNPSEIGDVDSRFVGRQAIADHLKTLLTSHETKSGSYLVTGYRGAGKSSLVAKVLSEISFIRARNSRPARYFRILAPLVALAFLLPVVTAWRLVPFLLGAAISFYYLFRSDPSRDDLLLAKGSKGRRLAALGRTFIMESGRSPELRFRALLQDVYLVCLAQMVAMLVIRRFDLNMLRQRLGLYLVIYGLIVASTAIVIEYRRAEKVSREPVKPRQLWRIIYKRAIAACRNYVNYSHRVYVKVNLGQDDLHETEILRLIARSVLTRYRAFTRSSAAYASWRLIGFAALYFAVGAVYYYQPIYRLNSGLKIESQLYRYFPSQGTFLLRQGRKDLDEILAASPPGNAFHLESFAQGFNARIAPEHRPAALLVHFSGALGGLRRAAVYVLAYVDLFVYVLYSKVLDNLPLVRLVPHHGFNQVREHIIYPVAEQFEIVPEQLDYLFFLYLYLAWLLIGAVPRLLGGMVTHRLVLRRLTELNDAIDAQVTKEQTGTLGMPISGLSLGFSGRSAKVYPVASVREIERRLLDILDDIDRLPRLTVRPHFLFIFDELDKIEPHKNIAISEKEEEDPASAPKGSKSFSSYEAARERQQRILGLLANLKHFFTTAKAKFIFIAGREMLDASLADVSDRHFFMGSIFNDVIYVPSFLRDPSDRKLADITSMTETYVCRFLLPPRFPDRDVSLKTYNTYLRQDFFAEEESGLPDIERELRRKRREKIIYDLSAFIVYLTYRSNGSPKKITRFFEEHIKKVPKEELRSAELLVVGHCSGSLYLELNFYDQYTFGLVMYLANPVFLSLNKTIKDYGDKLLVSTAFLLDHIYKFHSFGFSWRNLELIPEIIDINKAPELRELISNIIHFLSSAHIDEVSSGLYDFRFRRQIAEEISFLSKISEREAAAFNFTLDESLSLKRHYNRRLAELTAAYGSSPGAQGAEYVHSIGFVRMILGDLHFYDEEYDQAIIEYMDAVQSIQEIEPEKLNIRRLLVLVRNLLKLGFAFEKKRTFDSALVAYGRLTNLIARVRSIDLAELLPAGRSGDLAVPDGVSDVDIQSRLRGQPFSAARSELAAKMAAFSGIRLLYQPLLAKLQVIEKVSQGGLTRADIATVEDEFDFLVRPLDGTNRGLITAEFKARLGDILFFKNGPLPLALRDQAAAEPAEQVHCLEEGALCSPNLRVKALADEGYPTPCRACRGYHESLTLLLESAFGVDCGRRRSLLALLFEVLDRPILDRRAATMNELGRNLAAAGDAFLSCAAEEEPLDEVFLCTMLSLLPMRKPKAISEGRMKAAGQILLDLLGSRTGPLRKLEEAILYYLVAGHFHRLAGDHKSHSFQLTKILFVLRESFAIRRPSLSAEVVARLEAELVWRAIRGIYRTYESTHRLEIETFQEIMELQSGSRHKTENVRLNNVSLSFEVREIVILFNEIKLRVRPDDAAPEVGGVAGPYLFISPYSLINSIYNRIHELRFRGNANYATYKKLGFESLRENTDEQALRIVLNGARGPSAEGFGFTDSNFDRERAPALILEFLITDSIFCFHEIVRSLRIYGISFMANHSVRAAAHEKLAAWCRRYFYYLASCRPEARERIEQRLIGLIGKADLISIAPNYHYELAMVHYRAALETHSEGRAYKELIERMYYLNDDFGDKLTHFCAALERYRIHSGKTREKIDRVLIQELRGTSVYKQDRYFLPEAGETAGPAAALTG